MTHSKKVSPRYTSCGIHTIDGSATVTAARRENTDSEGTESDSAATPGDSAASDSASRTSRLIVMRGRAGAAHSSQALLNTRRPVVTEPARELTANARS